MKSGWSKRPKAFKATVALGIVVANLKLAEQAFNLLVQYSPVDTGSFRASWRVAINRVDRTITTSADRANALPAPKFPQLRGFRPGDKINITNSQPYGPYLELGTPKMVPIGMVRRTMVALS